MTQEELLQTDITAWCIEQAIITEWYDGPEEGFCQFFYPKGCFF